MLFMNSSHLSITPVSAGVIVFLLLFGWFIHTIYLGPLRTIPGPRICRLSSWWLVYQARRLRRSTAVKELHNRYGPVVRISSNHVSFAKPEALKTIYGHRPVFEKGPFYDVFHQGGPTLFSARSAKYSATKRKYLNPGFQPRALHAYESRMQDDILNLKKALLEKTAGHEAQLDFNVWSKYFTLDVICKYHQVCHRPGDFVRADAIRNKANYAFGAPFGFLEAGKDKIDLVDVLDKRGEAMQAYGVVPNWAKPLMPYLPFDRFWSEGLKAKSGLQKFGREAIQHRKENFDPNNPDLLSLLFEAKLDGKEDARLPEKEIISDAVAFIIGGSDAPSIAMTQFMDFVSRDMDLQRRLQEEIDAVFPGPLAQDWVAPDTVSQSLPLLNAAIKESQRLVPTSSTGLERVVPDHGTSICGHFIPGGTLVSVPSAVVMHDPELYEDPEKFNLDRWLADDSKRLNEYFHPFSLGPRSCIGRSFAAMEMGMSLATLLRTFTFERTTTQPTNLREAFTLKPEECWVVIRARTK